MHVAYCVCDKLGILAMRAVVLSTVEYADSVVVRLRQVAEELAKPRLVVLPHLWSRRHDETSNGSSDYRCVLCTKTACREGRVVVG
jgi:hypothetical protein